MNLNKYLLQIIRIRFLFLIIVLLYSDTITAQIRINKEVDKLKALGLYFTNNNENSKAERIVAVWDSIGLLNIKGQFYEILPVEVWEEMLLGHYMQSLKTNNKTLQLKLALPLASVYHTQAKFNKSMPLLQTLFQNLNALPKNKKGLVLIKLEETYRNSNEISAAIEIRNIRLENGLINTFWEIYRDCGLYKAAWQDFVLFEPFPSKDGIEKIKYYAALAGIIFEAKEYDSARKYYQKGLDQAELLIKKSEERDNADLYWKGYFKGFIAACDIATEKYSKAIPDLLYDISLSTKNIDNQIFKSLVLADCYIHLNETNNSKRWLDSARGNLKQKSDKRLLLKFYQVSADYFKSIEMYDSTIFFKEAYSSYLDTLNTHIQRNQSVLLLAKLDLEKRRKDLATSLVSLSEQKIKNKSQKTVLTLLVVCLIASLIICLLIIINSKQKAKSKEALKIHNQYLIENTKRIESQNNYNEILLKELHHRVKNNLQVIYSLLNLQKRRNTDSVTIALLESLQSRIQTMALIHQNLYSNDAFDAIEVKEYAETLVNHLETMYISNDKEVSVIYEVEEIKLSLDKAISLGLIINEAVSNSFKYAFKENQKGELLICIKKTGNTCFTTIKDTGKGFNSEEINKKSIGLKLIKTMCEQLKATYTLSHESGVEHQITFNF
jgi:two-component sensor histidine kinase